jgi:heptosyltransferase I
VSFDPGSEKKIARLLVVRLSAMGDVIHTLPAVPSLREAFPEAHIGWLIEERWVELLCAPGAARRGPRSPARPLVDEFHAVNLKTWGKSLFSLPTLQSVATVWNDVRDAHYDVAIDLQGAIRSAVLARWAGAPVVFGAAEPRESPASLWYTRKVVQTGRHVIEQNLSVAEAFIGHTVKSAAVEFPRDARAEERIERQLEGFGVQNFAILNPGAGWGAKRWPAERYGEVARGLATLGLQSILNYGPGEEELVREAEVASGGAARAISCTISELIALTRRARLFVGGDTGPLHLAAAMRVPVVGIYGPTDPARNGPYGTQCIVLRSAESLTSHARRTNADEGLLTISSEVVADAARKLLSTDLRPKPASSKS